MLKKLFALASFTAMTGVVAAVSAAGCSSSTTSSSGTDTDASTVKPKDASTDRATTTDTDSGPATCPTTTPVNATDLPWKSPTPTQVGKCKDSDLTAMNKYLTDNPSTTNDQFMSYVKTLNSPCYDCMFSDANGATWGPAPTSGGKLVTINIGACFALVSGKDDCGKAIQNEFDCEFVACADCADNTAFSSCRTKSQTGACKPYVQAIQSACNGVPTSVDNVCGSFFQSVRVQCVTTMVDAGEF